MHTFRTTCDSIEARKGSLDIANLQLSLRTLSSQQSQGVTHVLSSKFWCPRSKQKPGPALPSDAVRAMLMTPEGVGWLLLFSFPSEADLLMPMLPLGICAQQMMEMEPFGVFGR